MNRRDFINKLAIGTAVGAGVVTLTATLAEIAPPETESFSLLNLGHLEDYPLNEFSFLPEKKIYLQRTRLSLRALSGVCTHLGCTINKSEKGFLCPCHGSAYDKFGRPLSGPASRELDRYQLILNKEGEIIVNLKELVTEDFPLS